eukprot:6669040-Pyramimonas_sp.AAC.1
MVESPYSDEQPIPNITRTYPTQCRLQADSDPFQCLLQYARPDYQMATPMQQLYFGLAYNVKM